MRVPTQPLSEQEEALLAALLEESASVSLPAARGVFTALACEPSMEDPSTWLPLVLGTDVPDKTGLRKVFGLLMRDRYAIRDCFELGEPYVPAPADEDDIERFCKGFVRATRKSRVWQNDVEALGQTLPLAVLAGYLSIESLQKLNPSTPIDEQAWKAEHREKLQSMLRSIYEHFEPRRREQKAVHEGVEKIGRNEPCPCGSGKKFKKCCGAG